MISQIPRSWGSSDAKEPWTILLRFSLPPQPFSSPEFRGGETGGKISLPASQPLSYISEGGGEV